MKKVEVKMNKPIYLGQAILDISKTLMYEFCYDYIRPKYKEKARRCCMNTNSFVMFIKTEDFYKDIASDVERWFETSKQDGKDKGPLPIDKNKKVIGTFKDELSMKIMTDFCALRAKTYSYRLNDDTEEKKAKGTKKSVVKRELAFKNYMDSLFNGEVMIRSQQRFRSDHHRVYMEEVNKIALSSNDDKRIQTFDKVTMFPYGTNVFKVCESEMLSKNELTEPDEEKNTPKDKDKDKDKTRTKDIDKTTPKTKARTKDKDKTKTEYKVTTTPKTRNIPKTKTKIEDNDKTTPKTKAKIEDKDEDINKGRNKFIQVFQHAKQKHDKKGNWKKRQGLLG